MNPINLIHNAKIVLPNKTINNGWIEIEDGRIKAVGEGQITAKNSDALSVNGLTVLPGFIDVHVHGGANAEAMDATPEALETMSRFYAEHGVTSYLATTWTDTRERIYAALCNIKDYMSGPIHGARVFGAHLEGPYLNPEKCGAQNVDNIRRAERDEALSFLDIEVIKLVALAPEYPENHWLIEECVKRGITVSAAHTAATYEDMLHAFELGVRQTTHTFNAMPSLHHRLPGLLGVALTNDAIKTELIADTIHVHPAVMNILYRAKGLENIILISDAIRSAGMSDGQYNIDERTVTVKDGVVRLPDGTLAGSTLTMDRALKNFIEASGTTLDTAWRAASLNPAKAQGIDTERGSIEINKFADFAIVDNDLKVYYTLVEGQLVYQKGT